MEFRAKAKEKIRPRARGLPGVSSGAPRGLQAPLIKNKRKDEESGEGS